MEPNSHLNIDLTLRLIFRIISRLTIIISLLFWINCSEGGGGSGGSGSGGDINLSGDLSGKVSSDIQAGDVSGSLAGKPGGFFGMGAMPFYQGGTFGAGLCSNADYQVYVIGGGGSVYASGSLLNGTFQNVAVPTGKEVVLTFACDPLGVNLELRCFGKGGTSDLLCDPLSHAVVVALEESLALSITDPLFDGTPVSIIAAGNAATLRMEWSFGASPDLSADIIAALGNATELYNILLASSFGDTLSLLTLAAEQIKEANTAGGQTDQQIADATWTPGNVIKYLTNLGISVFVQLEDSDGPGVYSPLMDAIDGWQVPAGTYHADLQAFIKTHFDKLYGATPVRDPMAMVCIAENDYDWQVEPLIYPPVLNTATVGDPNDLTCIPDNANMQLLAAGGRCLDEQATQVECDGAGAPYVWDSNRSDCKESSITTKTACDGAGNGPSGNALRWRPDYRISLVFRPASIELNRNDPTGKNVKENRLTSLAISSVDIFKEVESALGFDGLANANDPVGRKCDGLIDKVTFALNPTPADCDPTELGKYFAGVYGIYKFFRNITIRDIKFSLNDLHDAFTNPAYMSVRYDGELSNIVRQGWIDFTASDNPELRSSGPRWHLQDNNDGTLTPICPFGAVTGTITPVPAGTICDDNVNWDHTIDDTTLNQEALVDTILANTEPKFLNTFEMFTQIPTLTEIQNSVFTSAHHEPWNIAGSKYFGAKGVNSDANAYDAEIPILCSIANANSAGGFVPGASSITCIQATGTWTNGDPDAATYSLYKDHYTLQERGGKYRR